VYLSSNDKALIGAEKRRKGHATARDVLAPEVLPALKQVIVGAMVADDIRNRWAAQKKSLDVSMRRLAIAMGKADVALGRPTRVRKSSSRTNCTCRDCVRLSAISGGR
jgi:hypothetical protein